MCLLAKTLPARMAKARRDIGLRRRAGGAERSRANGEHGAEPHTPLLYNGIVWEESSCGEHKERHRKVRKWREMQRAVCEDKKAVLNARSSVGGQKNSIGHKELCGKGRKGCQRVPARGIFGRVTGKSRGLPVGGNISQKGRAGNGWRQKADTQGASDMPGTKQRFQERLARRQCVIKSAKRHGRGYEDI